MSVIAQNFLYLGKVVVFGQSGCISVNAVKFWQKYLYAGKSGYIRQKWLYSGKVVAFG